MEKLTADCVTAVIQSMAEGGWIFIKSIITHPLLLILFAVPTVWKIRHIFSR